MKSTPNYSVIRMRWNVNWFLSIDVNFSFEVASLAIHTVATGNIFNPSKNQKIQERKICHHAQVARDRNRIDEVLVPLVIHFPETGIFNFRLE